jgi:hypothetical protein
MAYWRMKLRAGSHGPDMWPLCKEYCVAAITYNPIEGVDLEPYSRKNRPPGWEQIKGAAAKGSLSFFAWDIRGGDAIYVADSVGKKIVGMGYAKAPIGELAYYFDAVSPIVDLEGDSWRHLIDVDWDQTFVPFPYEHPRAALHTVLKLNDAEIEKFERATQETGHRQTGLNKKEVRDTLLLETAYPRYTPAAMRLISRKHVELSNRFKVWLQNTSGIHVNQEQDHIDATFEVGKKRFLAEFKIAYLGNTKKAIREALGQILEYNHYPPKVSRDHWLLVLDTVPRKEDLTFLGLLRERFALPMTLGWTTDSAFNFEPPLSFLELPTDSA